MEVGIIFGFSGIGLLAIGNLILAAYNFGRLKQKVDDLCGRMDRVEHIVNNKKVV